MKGSDSMQMINVDSRNISSIGYENNILYVLFNNGSMYSYNNVPLNLSWLKPRDSWELSPNGKMFTKLSPYFLRFLYMLYR